MKSQLSLLIWTALVACLFEHDLSTKTSAHRSHGLSRRSLELLRSKGMQESEVKALVSEMKSSFKEKPGHDKKKKEKKKKALKCGEGLRSLMEMVLDTTDLDAKQLMAGVVDDSKFTLFAGNIPSKEMAFEEMVMPLETIDDRCFSVRLIHQMPTILCVGCRKKRNLWINALHEAILCKKTKVHGSLPLDPGPELEAEAEGVEEDKPKGINLHVSDSPLGKPEIAINGVTIQKMEEIKKHQAVAETEPKPPSPKIEDVAPDVENDPEEPDNSVNSMNQPRSEAETEALYESEAEHKSIDADDPRTPKYGYEATKEGYNDHILNKK